MFIRMTYFETGPFKRVWLDLEYEKELMDLPKQNFSFSIILKY